MIISGLIRGSLIDYPGVPSCVLFVPGCNYDCYYCHNRSILGDEYEVIRIHSAYRGVPAI
jgi:pyruvate formate lyase activating enzyme